MEETTSKTSINGVMDVDVIKLIKNTKGYNWEIKLCGKVEDNLKRLKVIDDEMCNDYGSDKNSNLCD